MKESRLRKDARLLAAMPSIEEHRALLHATFSARLERMREMLATSHAPQGDHHVDAKHDCPGCGQPHGVCQHCGATHGDSHEGSCQHARY